MTATSRTDRGRGPGPRTGGRAARALPPRLLDSDLFLLALLAHDGRRRLAPVLARIALGPREFAVLSVLDDLGAPSQQAVVETLRIDPSEIVAAVDLLEAHALARRERDAADRRRYAVSLTARGRRVLRDAEALAGRVADDVLAALGARDRAALHRLLLRAVAGDVRAPAGARTAPGPRARTGRAPGTRAPPARRDVARRRSAPREGACDAWLICLDIDRILCAVAHWFNLMHLDG